MDNHVNRVNTFQNELKKNNIIVILDNDSEKVVGQTFGLRHSSDIHVL